MITKWKQVEDVVKTSSRAANQRIEFHLATKPQNAFGSIKTTTDASPSAAKPVASKSESDSISGPEPGLFSTSNALSFSGWTKFNR